MSRISNFEFRISPKKGFTIVELLVVVAIFALLGSLIFTQLRSTRGRARDVEREEEIKSLQNALAIYVVNAGNYPIASGPLTGSDPVSLALLAADALISVPLDPLNSGNFRYVYDSADGIGYTLTYWLETSSIPGKSAGQQTASP